MDRSILKKEDQITDELADLRERIVKLSDEELQKIVQHDKSYYSRNDFFMIKDELKRRNKQVKRPLQSEAVANLLLEDIFCLLIKDYSTFLGDELTNQIKAEGVHRQTECMSEYFSLIAFLITFSFQTEFRYLSQEKTDLILDLFHGKLFDYVREELKVDTFSEQIEDRYAEYYPAMNRDLECLRKKINLFGNMTETFFKKIESNKTFSIDGYTFRILIAELYSRLIGSLKKIKEYEIE